MGLYTYLSNNNDIPIPGGNSFVWQCITYLATCDLIYFTLISLGIVAFGVVVKMFINIMED